MQSLTLSPLMYICAVGLWISTAAESLSTTDRNDRYLLLLGRIHGNSYTISVVSCYQRTIGMATVHQESNLPRFVLKQDTDLI